MAWSDAARRAALDVRRMRSRRLFHGTSTNVQRVTPQKGTGLGRRGVFLTTDPREAREYAHAAAEQHGGQPAVFVVRAKDQPQLKRLGFRTASDKPKEHHWYVTRKALAKARRLNAPHSRSLFKGSR